MEDAAEKLDELARAEKQCTKCDDIVSCRLRALSGAGHPHAQVMFVSLHPSPEEEAGDLPAGTAVLRELAELIPSLSNGGRAKAYFTTVVKCVPRSDCHLRRPTSAEQDNCYSFLSREISITTPHYVVPIGDEASRFLLGKLFGQADAADHDPLEVRVYDSPSFKVVPIAAPGEIAVREPKARDAYVKRLRSLAAVMGL
jgi:uracil-DNA glycosylase family 4